MYFKKLNHVKRRKSSTGFFPGTDLEGVWSNLHISRDYSDKILDQKIPYYLFGFSS